MNNDKKSVVVIGGGTGTFAVLNALRDQDVDITALMTMVDDGGSNKVLRDEFGLLPTSGIRLAMVALSKKSVLLRDLFLYRFHQGTGIAGMTFGNLFLAAMADILESQEKAIEETSKFLAVKGRVLPISYDDVRLIAKYEDGSEVIGEHMIDEPEHDGKLRIIGMRTDPVAKVSEQARLAIVNADVIIFGPGDFFTNTVANLIIEGVPEAVAESKAKIIFVMNLMTKYGETYGYKASDYVKEMVHYLPSTRLDHIIINENTHFPEDVLLKYQEEHAAPVADDLAESGLESDIKVHRASLFSSAIVNSQKGDIIKRSMIRHDIKKLSDSLMEVISKF